MSAFVNAVAIPTITMLAAIGLTVPPVASASPATQDPLQRKVESLALQGEYFVDGIAKLNSLEKDVATTPGSHAHCSSRRCYCSRCTQLAMPTRPSLHLEA